MAVICGWLALVKGECAVTPKVVLSSVGRLALAVRLGMPAWMGTMGGGGGGKVSKGPLERVVVAVAVAVADVNVVRVVVLLACELEFVVEVLVLAALFVLCMWLAEKGWNMEDWLPITGIDSAGASVAPVTPPGTNPLLPTSASSVPAMPAVVETVLASAATPMPVLAMGSNPARAPVFDVGRAVLLP